MDGDRDRPTGQPITPGRAKGAGERGEGEAGQGETRGGKTTAGNTGTDKRDEPPQGPGHKGVKGGMAG